MPLPSVAVEAGSILFREGLEAALVVGALASFLARAAGRARIGALMAGVGLALVASLAAAVLFALFNHGDHNDLVEGLTMIVAAALMLYMSGWLMLRSDPRHWIAKLKSDADAAVSKGDALAVASLGFLAVFREGAETILFLHALAQSNGGYSLALMAGLGAGAGILALVVAALYGFALRLPMRPLFAVTSAFLFVMGVRFVAAALQEFQEMGLVPFDAVAVPNWLADIGVAQSLQGLTAQAAVIIVAIGGTLYAAVKADKPARVPAAE